MSWKIKDRITLGVLAGVIGGIPPTLLNTWQYRRGYVDFRYATLAASLFNPKGRKVTTGMPLVVGHIVHQMLLAVNGVATTYVLTATGRDKGMLKGAGVFLLQWLGLYGLSQKTGITTYRTHFSDLLAFADHAIGGLCVASAVMALGDDSLFPDAPRRLVKEEVPRLERESQAVRATRRE
jgi:hypothetical protein